MQGSSLVPEHKKQVSTTAESRQVPLCIGTNAGRERFIPESDSEPGRVLSTPARCGRCHLLLHRSAGEEAIFVGGICLGKRQDWTSLCPFVESHFHGGCAKGWRGAGHEREEVAHLHSSP